MATTAPVTWTRVVAPSPVAGEQIETYHALINRNGYQIRLADNGRWYPTVRCITIGLRGYVSLEEAIAACHRNAGVSEFSWSLDLLG